MLGGFQPPRARGIYVQPDPVLLQLAESKAQRESHIGQATLDPSVVAMLLGGGAGFQPPVKAPSCQSQCDSQIQAITRSAATVAQGT